MPRFTFKNQSFTPQGSNYTVMSGGSGTYPITFDVGQYNSGALETAMAAIASYGYNTVRLTWWPTNSGNPSGAGVNPAYAANVADGIKRAANHGLAVVLDLGGLPSQGGYIPGSIAPYSFDANWFFLTTAARTARNQYVADALTALAGQGVTAAMLLQIELAGEIGFPLNTYPFSLSSGMVTTATGTYDMSNATSRAACRADGIVAYIASQRTAIRAVMPVPIEVQLLPQAINQQPAYVSLDANAAIINSSNIDALILSLYPCYGVSLAAQIASIPVTFPISKPVMMELDWFDGGEPTAALVARTVEWIAQAATYGVYGYLWFSWDQPPAVDFNFLPMIGNGGYFARALSPRAIGDGSGGLDAAVQAVGHGTPTRAGAGSDAFGYEVTLLDGNTDKYLPWVPNPGVAGPASVPMDGPAIGVHNVSFNPDGGVLDKIGSLSWEMPLSEFRNYGFVPGVRVQLRDRATNIVMGDGKLTTRSMTIKNDGNTAQVTCPDLLDELRRVTMTAGFLATTAHVNTGPTDLLPSTPGETLQTTLNRIVGRYKAATWNITHDLGTAYDGAGFTTAGMSAAQCLGKAAGERFGHFCRGVGRTITFGAMKTASGLMLAGGAVDGDAAMRTNTAMRQILDGGLVISDDGNIINTVIPSGTGNGTVQLTLRQLYNPVGEQNLGNGVFQSGGQTFAGYLTKYPIRKRPCENPASTADGQEYFLQDDASVASQGVWEKDKSFNIGATGTTPGDFVNGAIALYNAAVAWLQWNKDIHVTYAVTTEGHGDLRNVAGKTVQLLYKGEARQLLPGGFQQRVTVDLNTALIVMEVKIAEDQAGGKRATWTLSNLGQFEMSDTQIVVSALKEVSYGHFTAQTYPAYRPLTFDSVADTGHVVTRVMTGNRSITEIRSATVVVYVVPARVPWRPHAHAAPIPAIPHDVNALPHDVAAIGHDVNPLGINLYTTGNPVQNTANGNATYDPQPSLVIHRQSVKPAGAQPMYFDGTGFYWDGTANHTVQLDHATFVIETTVRTTDPNGNPVSGTAGKVMPTTGAATGTGQIGGTVAKTTGGKGGALNANHPLAANFATQGDGVAADGTWALYENPATLPPITAKINNTPIAVAGHPAQFSGTTAVTFDATAAVIAAGSGQVDFSVTITPLTTSGNVAGLCQIYGYLELDVVRAAIAVT